MSQSLASSSASSEPEQADGILWTYSKNNNGTATITGYDKTATKIPAGEVTIPKVYKGYKP